MPLFNIKGFMGSLLVGTALLCVQTWSSAQSFNIDLDVPGTLPQLGGGVPSNAFGAAAGQVGVWNSIATITGPQALLDLSGAATSVNYSITSSSTSISTLAFNNPANTGDFALLFNDAQQIGTQVQGGTRTYHFSGLQNGLYSVYTYATPPQGIAGDIAINIPGSVQGTLMTNGVMTGNTFTLGVTHVIHTINLVGGSFDINMTDTPGSPSAYVNGFQIVLVPAPGTAVIMLLAPLAMMRRRRRA